LQAAIARDHHAPIAAKEQEREIWVPTGRPCHGTILLSGRRERAFLREK